MFKINLQNIIGYFSIIVIIVSLFSLGMNLTGKATTNSPAVVNITISKTVSINFTIDTVSFGSGSVDLGSDNATIDSLGNVVNGNWTPVVQGFRLENIGNTDVSLQLKSGKNASQFLGGTNPDYKYNATNAEAGSCTEAEITLGAWTDVNTTGDGDLICNTFKFLETADSLNINLRLVIPSDARIGSQSDIFTATGTSI